MQNQAGRQYSVAYFCKSSMYHLEKKNSALFVFPSHKIIVINSYTFCKPRFLHAWSTGMCENPARADFVSMLTILVLPLPL